MILNFTIQTISIYIMLFTIIKNLLIIFLVQFHAFYIIYFNTFTIVKLCNKDNYSVKMK